MPTIPKLPNGLVAITALTNVAGVLPGTSTSFGINVGEVHYVGAPLAEYLVAEGFAVPKKVDAVDLVQNAKES